MSYIIQKADGTAVTVSENIADADFFDATTNRGIHLIGRGTVNYGAAFDQNFVQLMENFSSGVVPLDATALQGQLWFKKTSDTNGELYVRTSGSLTGGEANWKKLVLPDETGAVSIQNYQSIIGNLPRLEFHKPGVTAYLWEISPDNRFSLFASNGAGVAGGSALASFDQSGTFYTKSIQASGTITGSNLSGINTGDQTITLTGDVTGTGTGSFGTSLRAMAGLIPGSYSRANISVDSAGRITAASSSVAASYTLDDLSNVVVPAASAGQVLSFNGLNWVNTTLSTAISGSTGLTASSTSTGDLVLTGTLSIANGGTGSTSAAGAITALGITPAAIGAIPAGGTLAIANGGTGSTTAAGAITNLGITPAAIGAMPIGGSSTAGAVFEIGRYLDFHHTAGTDYDVRLEVQSVNGANGGGSLYCHAAAGFTCSGNVSAFSDANLKTDLVQIPEALSKVLDLTGYTYTRLDSGLRQTGLIAQDLQKVLPEAVDTTGEFLAIAYGNVVGLLVEAIKELKAEIDLRDKKQGISMRQFRLSLLKSGYLEFAENLVPSLSKELQIDWAFADTVLQNSPLVLNIVQGLGLNTEAIDDLFKLALTL